MSPPDRPKGEDPRAERLPDSLDQGIRADTDSAVPSADAPRRPPGYVDQLSLTQELKAGALALGVALEPVQVQQLLAYLALMRRWNSVYNITSVRDPADMLRQHLLDCLAVLPPLRAQLAGRGATPSAGLMPSHRTPPRILDVGSGGGLPGVVLAILQPQWDVTCIDTVAKKASFVRQVAGELGLKNLASVHGRVERFSPARAGSEGQGFEVITSRAFASLANFVQLTHQHLAPGGVWMAMKGALAADEQAAVAPFAQLFHVEPLQIPGLAAQRCLVWMRSAPDSAAALG